MTDLREEKIQELRRQHDLPEGILAQCVDDSGTVDTARLGIALQTRHDTKSGMTAANEGLVEALTEQYYTCQDRRDSVGMMRCKDQIFKLGGRLKARKKN